MPIPPASNTISNQTNTSEQSSTPPVQESVQNPTQDTNQVSQSSSCDGTCLNYSQASLCTAGGSGKCETGKFCCKQTPTTPTASRSLIATQDLCNKGSQYCVNEGRVAVCKFDKSGYNETNCSPGTFCDSSQNRCVTRKLAAGEECIVTSGCGNDLVCASGFCVGGCGGENALACSNGCKEGLSKNGNNLCINLSLTQITPESTTNKCPTNSECLTMSEGNTLGACPSGRTHVGPTCSKNNSRGTCCTYPTGKLTPTSVPTTSSLTPVIEPGTFYRGWRPSWDTCIPSTCNSLDSLNEILNEKEPSWCLRSKEECIQRFFTSNERTPPKSPKFSLCYQDDQCLKEDDEYYQYCEYFQCRYKSPPGGSCQKKSQCLDDFDCQNGTCQPTVRLCGKGEYEGLNPDTCDRRPRVYLNLDGGTRCFNKYSGHIEICCTRTQSLDQVLQSCRDR